jgi:aspartate/methionine/tyrosine aminotransferase
MPAQPRPNQSPYIVWLKSLAPVTYNLAFSGVPSCPPGVLSDGVDHFETHEHGWRPALERIGARYGVSPESVVMAHGTTGANFVLFAAILSPGDHVVIEHPAYDPLAGAARFLGADVGFFERRPEERYRVDVDRVARALTARTNLVIVTNLYNPVGVRLSSEELSDLAALAEEREIHILVDEVYLEWFIDSGVPAAATLSPWFISTSSLTKAYGLGALRSGWVLAQPELAARIRDVMTLFDNNMPHPVERLTAQAFDKLSELVDPWRARVANARALVGAWVASDTRLSWVEPSGGTVGFVRIEGRDVDQLVEQLRTKSDTLVVPGSFFGAPEYVRIGLGLDPDRLREGLSRISDALRSG